MDNNVKGFNPNLAKIDNVVIKTNGFTSYRNISNSNNKINSSALNINLENVQIESVNLNNYLKMNIPTDVEGYYGGNQSTPMSMYRKNMWSKITFGIVSLTDFEKRHLNMYYTILSKYGITKESMVNSILSSMEDNGCGYITIVNIIADYYRNDPDSFEKAYGFPLYDTNQDGKKVFNYDYMLVDIFARSNIPRKSSYTVQASEYEKVMQNAFLGQKVSVEILPRDISINSYKTAMESGKYQYASIAVSKYKLSPYGNNSEKEYYSSIGHFMTITGISENGNFIVSSWGYEWELIEGTPYTSKQDGGLFLINIGDDN